MTKNEEERSRERLTLHVRSGPGRRRFLLGMLGIGAALPAISPSTGRAQGLGDKTGPEDEDEDDSSDGRTRGGIVGVAQLRKWMEEGKSNVPLDDARWTYVVSSVGNYAFYTPVGWPYFEGSDPNSDEFPGAFATSTQIHSPDAEIWCYVIDIRNYPQEMSTREYIRTRADRLSQIEEIEVIAEVYYSLLNLEDSAFFGAYLGEYVVAMQVHGSMLNDRSSGLVLSSFSVTMQLAPASRFDSYTTIVFKPFLESLQRFSGGSGAPPPVSSPTA